MENIKFISPKTADEFERYYHFRWQLLREPLNLPLGSEQDEHEAVSFHSLAINSEGDIVGVGRISPEHDQQMRIRYMAVASQYRSQGIGSLIVQKLLQYAETNEVAKCWLHARIGAVTFYEKNGFSVVKSIETDIAVPHMLMEINLSV